MAISRVHTWSAGEVLLASDLNSEFNNVINNGSDLVSPFTKAVSMGGFALNFDAANTIALTATTSGVTLTGGTLREPAEDSITAHAGGTQAAAIALSAAKKYHRISVCATTGDSFALPAATAGQAHFVRNDGAAAAQAFGTTPDTINSVATATGVPLPAGIGTWYVCTTAGNWVTSQPPISISGNFAVTLTATGTTAVTLPTAGTLAILGANTFTGAQTTNATSGFNESKTTVASAAGPDVWTSTGNVIDYTGTVTATSFAAAPQAGVRRTLVCAGAAPFTAGANMLIEGYASGSTLTAAAGDQIDVVAITTTQFRLTIRPTSGLPVVGTSVPRSHLTGLTLSTAGSSSTMTTAAGQATDSATAAVMTLASSIGKTTASWTVGTGNGGLDTGAIANSTWYHFYLIERPDTQVVDVLFSLSASAPTMPTSYTLKRRIGAGKTDGSGNWTAFLQDGDYFTWLVGIRDVSTTGPGTSAVTSTLTVPTGVNVLALLNVAVTSGAGTGTTILLSDLAFTDAAPSQTAAPLGQLDITTNQGDMWAGTIRTNTSAQVRYRARASDGSIVVTIVTIGWFDRRGRDA